MALRDFLRNFGKDLAEELRGFWDEYRKMLILPVAVTTSFALVSFGFERMAGVMPMLTMSALLFIFCMGVSASSRKYRERIKELEEEIRNG